MTGGWITRADRERWQREAVRELAAILDDPAEQQRLRRTALDQAATWPTAEAALALVLAAYRA